MSKAILILSDVLRYDVAKDNMGFLGHLVEYKLASLYKITGELPSMSRTCQDLPKQLITLCNQLC